MLVTIFLGVAMKVINVHDDEKLNKSRLKCPKCPVIFNKSSYPPTLLPPPSYAAILLSKDNQ